MATHWDGTDRVPCLPSARVLVLQGEPINLFSWLRRGCFMRSLLRQAWCDILRAVQPRHSVFLRVCRHGLEHITG